MRTIRVTGKGQIKVRPDTTRITMTLDGLHRDYGETLRRSAEETETLKDVLSGFGFERADLKTLSFSVDTEYENYQDQNGVYRQRFAGYRFRHVLKLEFESDNERLGRILYALANCSVSPEFRISYTVKDPEAAKNRLLAAAVTDAAKKAEVLASAAGVKLSCIQNIDYSIALPEMEVHPARKLMAMNDAAYGGAEESMDLNIQPEEIVVNDTVTVTWELG